MTKLTKHKQPMVPSSALSAGQNVAETCKAVESAETCKAVPKLDLVLDPTETGITATRLSALESTVLALKSTAEQHSKLLEQHGKILEKLAGGIQNVAGGIQTLVAQGAAKQISTPAAEHRPAPGHMLCQKDIDLRYSVRVKGKTGQVIRSLRKEHGMFGTKYPSRYGSSNLAYYYTPCEVATIVTHLQALGLTAPPQLTLTQLFEN